MSHSSLGGIVWSLRLGNVDNCTRHAANHDHAAGRLALHQVLGDFAGPQIGTVHVDAPEFLNAVVWVFDRVEVFGEAGGGYEVVDFAVCCEDLVHGRVDGFGFGDVAVVSGDFGDFSGAWVLLAEGFHQEVGLLFAFFLWIGVLVVEGRVWEVLLTVKIDNGDVCSADDKCLAHDQSKTSSSACDNTASSWEVVRWRFGVEMGKAYPPS